MSEKYVKKQHFVCQYGIKLYFCSQFRFNVSKYQTIVYE